MRKFIVSDLHGDGNVYDSIISYLENIYNETNEDITLYINGDLIDRGYDVARMLLDVRDRIISDKGIKIEYLGGNHELLMYQALRKGITNTWPKHSDWFDNGGFMTAYSLEDTLYNYDNEQFNKQLKELFDFISNLKIYHKFKETIDNKKIVLVHSKCPYKVEDECPLRIKDNNLKVHNLVWTRKDDFFRNNIGHPDYFTIIGHTPLKDKYGYHYYKDENYLNIDGGCAGYVLGYDYDHVPLVEINDNYLTILTFNNNNEIIYGNYFKDYKSIPIEDLEQYRKYLNKNIKIKKRIKEEDSIYFE